MPLELAYNYGLPYFLNHSLVIDILFKSIEKTFSRRSNQLKVNMDKYWIIAFIVISISYLTDVTYYDGKISILTWILLAGLSSIKENQNIDEKIPLK